MATWCLLIRNAHHIFDHFKALAEAAWERVCPEGFDGNREGHCLRRSWEVEGLDASALNLGGGDVCGTAFVMFSLLRLALCPLESQDELKRVSSSWAALPRQLQMGGLPACQSVPTSSAFWTGEHYWLAPVILFTLEIGYPFIIPKSKV